MSGAETFKADAVGANPEQLRAMQGILADAINAGASAAEFAARLDAFRMGQQVPTGLGCECSAPRQIGEIEAHALAVDLIDALQGLSIAQAKWVLRTAERIMETGTRLDSRQGGISAIAAEFRTAFAESAG